MAGAEVIFTIRAGVEAAGLAMAGKVDGLLAVVWVTMRVYCHCLDGAMGA